MNFAREADRDSRIPEAIDAYEILVKTGKAELIDFLNLIVIYFNCMDFGYASAQAVGREIESIASTRALELISLARKIFGINDELLYWKSIIPFHGWSEDVPDWHLNGDSHVPYLYLARNFPTHENINHVKELQSQITTLNNSERKRYLEGKIEIILSDT